MITAAELQTAGAFNGLPDDQVEWFLSHVQEVSVHAGEAFVRQGDPAEWMFILLEGHFQWRGEFGGDTVALPAQAGDVSGVFPFSRMKRFTVTGRALTDGRIGRFPAVQFAELIQRMPELTTRLVAIMSERIREGTRIEQLRDRLVSLGRLSAGLAHELNNPASAAKRASNQMRDLLAKLRRAGQELWRQPINDADKTLIEEMEAALLCPEGTPLEGLALSDLEEQLQSILSDFGQTDTWELSAILAKCNMQPDKLIFLLTHLSSALARPALEQIAASAELLTLLKTIEDSSTRISKFVRTVKEYTCRDQTPVQDIDVARSLDTTLGTLAHILQPGVDVKRIYEAPPLMVRAGGTELNQVWTNLIENAVEAMQGQGELRLRTSHEDKSVMVEIGDSGCGIPEKIKPYILDPFFTTKDVGEGVGLGLNTVQTIIRKLGGSIQITSNPGDTRVQVWLPQIDETAPGT